MAPKGSEVKVIISNGSEVKKVNVPNLGGLTEEKAKKSLEDAKLELGNVEHDYSDTVPEGQVMDQSPAANKEVNEGDVIDITISDGPEKKTYTAKVDGVFTVAELNKETTEAGGNPTWSNDNLPKSGEQVILRITFPSGYQKDLTYQVDAKNKDVPFSYTEEGFEIIDGTTSYEVIFKGNKLGWPATGSCNFKEEKKN